VKFSINAYECVDLHLLFSFRTDRKLPAYSSRNHLNVKHRCVVSVLIHSCVVSVLIHSCVVSVLIHSCVVSVKQLFSFVLQETNSVTASERSVL
jgi:hypothetical protein